MGTATPNHVDDLLSRMTLEEKLAQLGSCWMNELQTEGALDPAKMQRYLQLGIGQITRQRRQRGSAAAGVGTNHQPATTLSHRRNTPGHPRHPARRNLLRRNGTRGNHVPGAYRAGEYLQTRPS